MPFLYNQRLDETHRIIHYTSRIPIHHHLSLLALNSSHKLPRMLARSELAVINSLPRTRVQPSIRNRHTNTSAHQTALNVRGHIVQTFIVVPVHRALRVLWRNAVQRISHILAHSRIGVLVQAERAGGVLDEEVHDTDFEVFELGELASDFVGDEVAAARFGGEGELFLEEGHAGRLVLWCC